MSRRGRLSRRRSCWTPHRRPGPEEPTAWPASVRCGTCTLPSDRRSEGTPERARRCRSIARRRWRRPPGLHSRPLRHSSRPARRCRRTLAAARPPRAGARRRSPGIAAVRAHEVRGNAGAGQRRGRGRRRRLPGTRPSRQVRPGPPRSGQPRAAARPPWASPRRRLPGIVDERTRDASDRVRAEAGEGRQRRAAACLIRSHRPAPAWHGRLEAGRARIAVDDGSPQYSGGPASNRRGGQGGERLGRRASGHAHVRGARVCVRAIGRENSVWPRLRAQMPHARWRA